MELLTPYLARLSCVVFVSLAWDGERRSLVDQIQANGVGCRPIVVIPEREEGGGSVTTISPSAIESGEAIVL